MSEPEFFINSQWSDAESDPSENTVIIINRQILEILEVPPPRAPSITAASPPPVPPFEINLNNRNNRNQEYIQSILLNQIAGSDHLLCSQLALHITRRICGIPYFFPGYILTVYVRITHRIFVDCLPYEKEKETILKRMVLKGRLDREEVMKMMESCSICLDDLSDSSKHGDITRMECSHVFHDDCLLKWLQKRNTCPLCRTVLYDQ